MNSLTWLQPALDKSHCSNCDLWVVLQTLRKTIYRIIITIRQYACVTMIQQVQRFNDYVPDASVQIVANAHKVTAHDVSYFDGCFWLIRFSLSSCRLFMMQGLLIKLVMSNTMTQTCFSYCGWECHIIGQSV